MKTKYLIIALAALCAFSCTTVKEEWEPVYTFKYSDGAAFQPVNMDSQVNCTIADLKAMYTKHGKPVQIVGNLIIKGQVTTSDEDGNVYREIYIQDETGGIDIKIGRSSSYDDYKVGQILYVNCDRLVLGEYGYKEGAYGGDGLLQLGYIGDGWKDYLNGVTSTPPEYETAYLDLPYIINAHIFRGEILPEDKRIKPNAGLKGTDLSKEQYISSLVRLNDVKYANSDGGTEVFCLFYPEPNLNHTKNEAWNRVFLSSPTTRKKGEDYTFGVKTWTLTKNRFHAMVEAGTWDDVEIGSGGTMFGTIGAAKTDIKYFGYELPYKDVILNHPSAQSVSHYFLYDGWKYRSAPAAMPASPMWRSLPMSVTAARTLTLWASLPAIRARPSSHYLT